MELAKELILDDKYRLRISSKKLQSGRYQVKFFATIKKSKELYGYVLVESGETLKSVINRIQERLKELDTSAEYHHFHLFQVGKEELHDNLMIFT